MGRVCFSSVKSLSRQRQAGIFPRLRQTWRRQQVLGHLAELRCSCVNTTSYSGSSVEAMRQEAYVFKRLHVSNIQCSWSRGLADGGIRWQVSAATRNRHVIFARYLKPTVRSARNLAARSWPMTITLHITTVPSNMLRAESLRKGILSLKIQTRPTRNWPPAPQTLEAGAAT